LTPPADLDLARAPEVPLAEGLVVVSAVVEDRGDYEVVKRISVGKDRIQVSYSATVPVDGVPTEARGARTVLAQDLKAARIYRIRWLSGRTELARGTTALGVSADVLRELRENGRSECSLASIEEAGSLIGAVGLPSPEYEGAFERVEPGPVPVPVVVDGARQWLPAIHAKGTFEGLAGEVQAEFWFLDNLENPLTLRGTVGTARLVVTRIDRPPTGKTSRLERALAEDDRVELPGVYFEFASATLRPESDAAITEVTTLLRRHPDWRLRFEGHTDSVGGAASNLELSRARADAVRAAVVSRLGGGADRLEAAGFGLTQPRETNDTPEGRARNRRVEMVRLR
jgi:outer membrane protein OmpA-like peptidoglycan-associated protein